MTNHGGFTVHTGWRVLMSDIGVSAENVLRRADLPADLFASDGFALNTAEYFRLWQALEAEADDPALPITIAGAMSVEGFNPSIFAALCSANLNQALGRIARYKRLTCPMRLHVDIRPAATRLALEWLDKTVDPPPVLAAVELVFFVQLTRLATRRQVRPLAVTTPNPPRPGQVYADYFGVPVQRAPAHAITFAAADAAHPFLTANDAMWRFFEPELETRLSRLEASASTAERVRAALLELLPAGTASVQAVSDKLGLSARTLQRRLNAEGQTFQHLLGKTRADLAKHYLKNTSMRGAEIAFLLGFDDPNSFTRAFHTWTGDTPEHVRAAGRAG